MLKQLDHSKIIGTVERLSSRIGDRFPHSGLFKVNEELLLIAQKSSELSKWIAKPAIGLRFLSIFLIVAFVVGLIWLLISIPMAMTKTEFGIIETITGIEAVTNELILIAAAIFFLTSLEKRLKRKKALAAIHELRSIAHIIDMHQLTKDPERFTKSWIMTENSPQQKMSPFELERYLDYCSEMLSLVGKISALYIQSFSDEVLLVAVSEIESLTTNLSAKIWQKIVVLKLQIPHKD